MILNGDSSPLGELKCFSSMRVEASWCRHPSDIPHPLGGEGPRSTSSPRGVRLPRSTEACSYPEVGLHLGPDAEIPFTSIAFSFRIE